MISSQAKQTNEQKKPSKRCQMATFQNYFEGLERWLSTSCSSTGPGLYSHHQPADLQASVSPILEALLSSSGFLGCYMHVVPWHICRQNTDAQKLRSLIKLNYFERHENKRILSKPSVFYFSRVDLFLFLNVIFTEIQ